jgi:hypothetical protein
MEIEEYYELIQYIRNKELPNFDNDDELNPSVKCDRHKIKMLKSAFTRKAKHFTVVDELL